jgi:hypothetical protein
MVLGEAGLLAVQEGSAMWLDVSDGCRLRVHLLDGQVSVHAADLGGGELRVLTPSGDVIVQGTVFSVTHGADALRVDVDEGRVGVQRAGQSLTTMLVGGQRLSMSATEPPRIDPLDAAARAELREQVGLVPAPQAATASEPGASTRRAQARSASAPSSADALVAEADALWRRGELAQARERYRKAGALGGATAEAALLALARRELGLGRTAAARAALQAYDARFPRGELAAESAGIAFRTALQEGDLAGARRSAELLQRRYPRTPQAEAAARWLAEHGRR